MSNDTGGIVLPEEPKSEYVAPTMTVEGSLQELTLIPKYTTNTPDGYTYGETILTT
jgi:hypothetical protein